jgi:hypothetical protein
MTARKKTIAEVAARAVEKPEVKPVYEYPDPRWYFQRCIDRGIERVAPRTIEVIACPGSMIKDEK